MQVLHTHETYRTHIRASGTGYSLHPPCRVESRSLTVPPPRPRQLRPRLGLGSGSANSAAPQRQPDTDSVASYAHPPFGARSVELRNPSYSYTRIHIQPSRLRAFLICLSGHAEPPARPNALISPRPCKAITAEICRQLLRTWPDLPACQPVSASRPAPFFFWLILLADFVSCPCFKGDKKGEERPLSKWGICARSRLSCSPPTVAFLIPAEPFQLGLYSGPANGPFPATQLAPPMPRIITKPNLSITTDMEQDAPLCRATSWRTGHSP